MSEIGTELIQGDCIDVMGGMQPKSVHAVVCDPPYGLAFMGKTWDDFEPREYQEWCEAWASEALRVLYPGGFLLAFSGKRTFHRLFSGVEDAGFEVRDTIMWLHAQGFPMGEDIGADLGEEWEGWNTELKPAFEPIVVAKKSIEEDSIVDQVRETGTGALNIGDCRIPTDETIVTRGKSRAEHNTDRTSNTGWKGTMDEIPDNPRNSRWPANVVVGESAARMLGDGLARYFYTAKAKEQERTVGGRVEDPHPTVKPIDLMEWMVKLVSAEGQTVLDPFAGTGTTLMAAYNIGRNAIGIEKDASYVETAKARVQANERHVDEVGTEPDHIYNGATDW